MLLFRQGLLQRQQEPSRLFAPKPLQLGTGDLFRNDCRAERQKTRRTVLSGHPSGYFFSVSFFTRSDTRDREAASRQHHGDDQNGEYIHHFLVLPVSFTIPKGYPIAGRKAIKPRERLYEDFLNHYLVAGAIFVLVRTFFETHEAGLARLTKPLASLSGLVFGV